LNIIKTNAFQTIFFEEPFHIFSKDFKYLKEQLGQKKFHFLIELNVPANISLPYLVSSERRICFYDKNKYPYFNILVKNDINVLNQFFNIKKCDPQKLFRFYAREVKKLTKKINKKRPLLFVNAENNIPWEGDKIIMGRDFTLPITEAFQMLYISDAYYGKRDVFYELAKVFNKNIIES
jgi:hypothetical protein